MGRDKQTWWQQIWSFIQVAFETWRFLAALITVLLALGVTGGIASFFIQNALLVIGAFLSTIVAGVLIITVIYLSNRVTKQHKVRILKKYVTYRYLPDLKTMEHTKDYRIIAIDNNVSSFIDRYKWSCTNQGRVEVTLLNPDQELTHQKLQEKKDVEWSINEIIFDPPLHKADRVSVQLRWDLYCDGLAQNFLSQIVDETTDRLTLSVALPYDPINIKFFEFNDGEGVELLPHTVVSKRSVDDEGCDYWLTTRELRYRIDKPKDGHKYAIKWDPPVN